MTQELTAAADFTADKQQTGVPKYSAGSNPIDYLRTIYPEFTNIRDIFKCINTDNFAEYEYANFRRLASMNAFVVKKMLKILQQYKVYILQIDSVYVPEKHTSLQYILNFFEFFGIEEYLNNARVASEKKMESLYHIDACFNFLYEFVYNKSITTDKLFDKYLAHRLKYIEIARGEKFEEFDKFHSDPSGVLITEHNIENDNSPTAQQNEYASPYDSHVSYDSPLTSAQDTSTDVKHVETANAYGKVGKDVLDPQTLPSTGKITVVHKIINSSNKPILVDFDLDDEDEEELPQKTELSYEQYEKLINVYNDRIFMNLHFSKMNYQRQLIESKLELMLGFFSFNTTSANLEIIGIQVHPYYEKYNNGLKILKTAGINKLQIYSYILRHKIPELCPVLTMCMQSLLRLYTHTYSKNLINLTYHEVIEMRGYIFKIAEIKNVSAFTTMRNVGYEFCRSKGLLATEIDELKNFKDLPPDMDHNSSYRKAANVLAGFDIDNEIPLKRTRIKVPTELRNMIVTKIIDHQNLIRDENVKSIIEYIIEVILQDFPYIFRKFPSNLFTRIYPFNTPQFKLYLESVDINMYEGTGINSLNSKEKFEAFNDIPQNSKNDFTDVSLTAQLGENSSINTFTLNSNSNSNLNSNADSDLNPKANLKTPLYNDIQPAMIHSNNQAKIIVVDDSTPAGPISNQQISSNLKETKNPLNFSMHQNDFANSTNEADTQSNKKLPSTDKSLLQSPADEILRLTELFNTSREPCTIPEEYQKKFSGDTPSAEKSTISLNRDESGVENVTKKDYEFLKMQVQNSTEELNNLRNYLIKSEQMNSASLLNIIKEERKNAKEEILNIIIPNVRHTFTELSHQLNNLVQTRMGETNLQATARESMLSYELKKMKSEISELTHRILVLEKRERIKAKEEMITDSTEEYWKLRRRNKESWKILENDLIELSSISKKRHSINNINPEKKRPRNNSVMNKPNNYKSRNI